jgi:hypothetical protein
VQQAREMDGAVGEGGEVDRTVVDDRPLSRLPAARVDITTYVFGQCLVNADFVWR